MTPDCVVLMMLMTTCWVFVLFCNLFKCMTVVVWYMWVCVRVSVLMLELLVLVGFIINFYIYNKKSWKSYSHHNKQSTIKTQPTKQPGHMYLFTYIYITKEYKQNTIFANMKILYRVGYVVSTNNYQNLFLDYL